MKVTDNDRVNKFMDDLQSVSPDKFEIIKPIRKIFLGANKELTEDIKYGGLVFNLSNVLVGVYFLTKSTFLLSLVMALIFLTHPECSKERGRKEGI